MIWITYLDGIEYNFAEAHSQSVLPVFPKCSEDASQNCAVQWLILIQRIQLVMSRLGMFSFSQLARPWARAGNSHIDIDHDVGRAGRA